MTLNNETVQYMQRLEQMIKDDPGNLEYAHKYRNWKDWLIYEAYRNEILTLKSGYTQPRIDEHDRPHALSSAERARIAKELRSFMEFVYRTWTDKEANAWVGGTWNRVGEAYAARSLFYRYERGLAKVSLRPKPEGFEHAVKTFCEVFGIAL